MAFIRFKNNKSMIVSPEQGLTMWRIMNAEIKGTKRQRDFIAKIHRIYLNRNTAPISYLKANKFIDYIPYKSNKLARQVRLPYVD